MIVATEQVRRHLQGKATSAVLPRAAYLDPRTGQVTLKVGRTTPLSRTAVEVLEDGKVKRTTEPVYATQDGERRREVVTILDVEDTWLLDLDLAHAWACGHRTVADLRDEWRAAHPRIEAILFVKFAIGDWRDVPHYLTWTRLMAPGRQGDYTANPSRGADGETLSREEYATLGMRNRQKDLLRQREIATSLADRSEARRLQDAAAAAERMKLNIRRELTVIGDRVERLERARAGVR